MSAPELIHVEPSLEPATLEILWQQDVGATVLVRGHDGSLSAGGLDVGIPAVSDLSELGQGATARRVGLTELIALASKPPADVELGGTARATFAVIELASRSVTEGLLHPQLQHGGRTWLAYWGATIDESVQQALDAIAAALPASAPTRSTATATRSFTTSTPAPSTRSPATGSAPPASVSATDSMRTRPSAPEVFLDGLTSDDPELPLHAGLGALERRLTDWVDRGLERRSSAPWLLSLRLDEQHGAVRR